MAHYQLTIQLTGQDTHAINAAQQQIVLVKEVGGSSGSQVVWVSFSPFENNVVTWEQDYGVYASTTEIEGGATILKTSTVNPATSGVIYPFQGGAFDPPTGTLGVNNYGIQNNVSQQFTFGLAQSVIANGSKFEASPLNAVPVLSNEPATFTPIERLPSLLHAKFDNGVIISEIMSKSLLVDFTSNSSVTIHYEQPQGKFIMGALPVAA